MLYSSFKAAHHLEKIAGLRKGELIAPTQVQIDLTNKCNHRCPYCFYRCARNERLNALFNENDCIPTERMLKLLPELRETGVAAIQYTGGGEPMCHPDFVKIIEETAKQKFDWSLVTNGSHKNMNGFEDIFNTATWVRVSVDAATRETYQMSQGTTPDDFDKAKSFIQMLTKKCPKVTVGVSFVINPINYKEIIEATHMAKEMGCSNIRFSIAYTPRGIDLYKDTWTEIGEISQRAKHFEDKTFKVFNLATAHLENLDLRQKGYSFCGYQHFTAVIGADQIVYPCCTLKYNSVTGFGNLKENTFKELWHGDKRKEWLAFDHMNKVCNKNPCWMDKKNEFISYLIQQDPPHVNYI